MSRWLATDTYSPTRHRQRAGRQPRCRPCAPRVASAGARHAHDQARGGHHAVVGAQHGGPQPARPVRAVRLGVRVRDVVVASARDRPSTSSLPPVGSPPCDGCGPTPATSTTSAALVAAEARPAHADRPWLLVNMVASLDGAITIDERSGGLGGPADKAMFFALRHVADVVLVGRRHRPGRGLRPAAGVRGGPRRAPRRAARRRCRGSRSSPARSTSTPSARVFTRSRATARSSSPTRRRRAERVAALADGRRGRRVGDDEVDLVAALRAPARRRRRGRHLRGRPDPQRRPHRPRPDRRVVPHPVAAARRRRRRPRQPRPARRPAALRARPPPRGRRRAPRPLGARRDEPRRVSGAWARCAWRGP